MPKLFQIVLIAAAAIALAQCSPKAEAPVASSAAKAPDFSYDIALSFTPEAAARLAKRHEKVTISALYYGTPTPAAAAAGMVDKSDGVLHFNTDLLETDATDHTVHMTGAGVDPARLKYAAGQKPLALINVYSTLDGKTRDHQVQCDVFEDYLSTAQEKPLAIHCS